MKKLLLMLPSVTYALYLGNPGEPQIIDRGFFISQESAISVKIGYEGDWIFDRKMKAQGSEIDRFRINMNQGVVTLGFMDRIELSASLGSFSAQFWNRPFSDSGLFEYETRDHFTVGGNLKVVLMQWNNTMLGIVGGYQHAQPPLGWMTFNGTSFANDGKLTYRELQAGIGFAHTVDIFTPYLAVEYANVKSEINGLPGSLIPHSHFTLSNRQKFSLVTGCTLSSGRNLDLNGEVRLFGEEAFTIAGNIKF